MDFSVSQFVYSYSRMSFIDNSMCWTQLLLSLSCKYSLTLLNGHIVRDCLDLYHTHNLAIYFSSSTALKSLPFLTRICFIKLESENRCIYYSAADPGVVETSIMREVPPRLSRLAFMVLRLLNLLQSPDKGVSSVIDAALAPPVCCFCFSC